MTKPVTRKMVVDWFLWSLKQRGIVVPCGICKEPLEPGDDIQWDHIHATVFWGPHEYQNIRPVHYDPCHKRKTKADVQANAKIDRITGKTKGRPKKSWPKRPMQSHPFQKRP